LIYAKGADVLTCFIYFTSENTDRYDKKHNNHLFREVIFMSLSCFYMFYVIVKCIF